MALPSLLCLLSVGRDPSNLLFDLFDQKTLTFTLRNAELRLKTNEIIVAHALLRRMKALLEPILREHHVALRERIEQRSQLRARILVLGVFSGQHVLSGGRGEMHGRKLQEGRSRPGRGIHGLKARLRQEGRNPVCF